MTIRETAPPRTQSLKRCRRLPWPRGSDTRSDTAAIVAMIIGEAVEVFRGGRGVSGATRRCDGACAARGHAVGGPARPGPRVKEPSPTAPGFRACESSKVIGVHRGPTHAGGFAIAICNRCRKVVETRLRPVLRVEDTRVGRCTAMSVRGAVSPVLLPIVYDPLYTNRSAARQVWWSHVRPTPDPCELR